MISLQGNFEKVEKVGDLLEFRLDLMKGVDRTMLSLLRKKCKVPVIFTYREGGKKILDYLDLKPDYVDIDYNASFREQIPPDIEVIASYHNFEETPGDLEEILKEMNHFPAKIKKIATMANSALDALRMLNFVQKHGVAGMCMGKKGEATRILGPLVGAPLTYCCYDKATAPGQLTVHELQNIYRFRTLSKDTKAYALIGDPVEQSIGHLFHNKTDKNTVYVKLSLKEEELPSFFNEIETLPFSGFSVTMPLKEKVSPFLENASNEPVNTLTKTATGWMGTNTDGAGAFGALGEVKGKVLLIIGAGGAATAIAKEGFLRGATVIIANRTFERGKRLAKKVGGIAIPIDAVPKTYYDILINATSSQMPLLKEGIHENKTLFDLTVRPKETPFLAAGREKGCKIIYGEEMFTRQAAIQQKEWKAQS